MIRWSATYVWVRRLRVGSTTTPWENLTLAIDFWWERKGKLFRHTLMGWPPLLYDIFVIIIHTGRRRVSQYAYATRRPIEGPWNFSFSYVVKKSFFFFLFPLLCSLLRDSGHSEGRLVLLQVRPSPLEFRRVAGCHCGLGSSIAVDANSGESIFLRVFWFCFRGPWRWIFRTDFNVSLACFFRGAFWMFSNDYYVFSSRSI